jgi:Toprim domain-containing protein
VIGRSLGTPIVLAPINDLLGLAITEGIEEGLTIYRATGLGVWAAGSASRMSALATAVPNYVECISVIIDDDDDGRRHAATLMERLKDRNIELRPVQFDCRHQASR